MKHLHLLASLAACVALCCCATVGGSSAKRTAFPDNAYQEIPEAYFRPCDKAGTVVNFTYKTRDNQTPGSLDFEKTALVYLPYGYDANDKTKRYDVLYLMHGGGDNPGYYLGTQNPFIKNVIDHMITDGMTRPLLICAVSYYTQYSNNATKNCLDFHYELDKDIIPIFEKQYHTYARNTSQAELDATRGHRAFSGFSMGGITTWAIFEHDLNEIKYYLPISGEYWAGAHGRSVESVKILLEDIRKHNKSADDFKIYAGCGRTDIAEPNLTPMINEMKKYPDTFKYCDNFKDGNFYQCISEKTGHDPNTVVRILFNGLPKMFD